MNKVILIGRLTKEPDAHHTQGEKPLSITRFTLAADRRFKRDGEQTADFVNCVAFGKTAEVIEKYVTKGQKVSVAGRIQTGSYTNKDGQKVYTTDVIVEEFEFVESKTDQSNKNSNIDKDGFMQIPDGKEEELPFN